MADSDRQQVALAVIAEVSGIPADGLSPKTELVADLGIDSAKALTMLVELEDRLGIEIDDEDVTDLSTVADVLRAIQTIG